VFVPEVNKQHVLAGLFQRSIDNACSCEGKLQERKVCRRERPLLMTHLNFAQAKKTFMLFYILFDISIRRQSLCSKKTNQYPAVHDCRIALPFFS